MSYSTVLHVSVRMNHLYVTLKCCVFVFRLFVIQKTTTECIRIKKSTQHSLSLTLRKITLDPVSLWNRTFLSNVIIFTEQYAN